MTGRYYLPLLIILILSTCARAQGTRARAEVRLDEVYDTYSLDGTGTLVVMLDRGIDYHHPAYLNPDGTTRLAYVFDMVAAHDGNEYGVGAVLDTDAINGDLMTDGPPLSNDNHGHGTATTGIIAGSDGGLNDDDFSGVAPGATIISVKMVRDGFPAAGGSPGEAPFFDPSYIPIALDFARDKIAELGLPSVTLMNIGSLGGPTDGTGTVGRAITDFAEEHPFVCGTGDDGGADNVARGSLNATGNTSTVDLRIQKLSPGNLDAELWYSAGDRFEASLITPGGTVLTPGVPANNQRTQETGDNATIWHNGSEQDFWGSTAPRRQVFVRITEGTGIYTLRLRSISGNDGSFIATMNPARFNNDNRFLDFASNLGSIADYGASPGVITPTDYVFNNGWTALDGSNFGFTDQGNLGEIWVGSSKGPTQDDRLGVDFAAPGEVLFGPYSPGSFYSRAASSLAQGGNGLYGIQNAVSAAAPLTTGVIALMLELDPTLTPLEILTILQQTAREDNFTGATPNNTWGHGKLDAKAVLDEVDRLTGTQEPSTGLFGVRVQPNPAGERVFLDVPAEVQLQEIRLLDLLGRPLRDFSEADLGPGLDLNGLATGTYLLRLRGLGGISVQRVVKK
ncbi:MAG: S8 family peptidase [Bacteroidota bacterium]